MDKIVTEFWMKPGPTRNCDWTAVYDDYDGAPDSGNRGQIGYGRTEPDAVLDLMDNWPRYPVECCDKETERCPTCGAYIIESDEFLAMPACRMPKAECGMTDMRDCTCRLESVHSASIDPPEMIVDRWCPIHGSGEDPDHVWEARRDDARFFGPETYHAEDF